MERFCLPLVDFILLAEFDIDEGSVLKVQYPRNLPIPSDKTEEEFTTLVPNMMLPDGCEKLEWDHCNLILYRSIHETNPVSPPLYGLNVVYRKLDNTVRRGAVVKALTILSPMEEICFSDGWATGMFPLLRKALVSYFDDNETPSNEPNISSIAELFNALNESAKKCCLSKICSDSPFLAYSMRSVFQKSLCLYKDTEFRIHFPVSSHTSGFTVGSISNLIRCLGGIRAVMEIHKAILLEKNVLFLAHNISSSELCTQVLASTLLVAPVVANLLRHRVFPYVSFNDLDFQKQKGYIAGTTNPFFKTSCNYHLLVDLNEATLSYKNEPSASPMRKLRFRGSKSKVDSCTEFLKHITIGMELTLGESWIKREIQSFTVRIADLSARHSDTPAQLYESVSFYINEVPHTIWFKEDQKRETKSEIRMSISPAVRKLFYAMNGLYKEMCSPTILSSLGTLSEVPREKKYLIEIISLLLRYFGSVDLTDAINRVTGTHDHENIEKFQCLNAALRTVYTDLFSGDLQLLQF